jgi:molybdate transport system substrate-binding protein
MNPWIKTAAALAAAFALQGAVASARAADVTVFAAASLKNALDAIVSDFRERTGDTVAVSYAASSTLARQIEQGAPADLFISADLDWMDYLQQHGLIRPETRRALLGNRIVLVAPKGGAAKPVELTPGSLANALGSGRLAIAATASVPAGKYGRAALEKLGLWNEVSDHLAEAENARAALAFVSHGEAPLGLVYETDARADPSVVIVANFPEASHPPIVYPAALTTAAKGDRPERLLETLRDSSSAEMFRREGFTPLD